ncbi:hypothetical protein MUP79_08650 [Candidatus Bathyarchaeota archaeon]|nr:hypothetical protein [Candidatus Bathyarchaeota archaeon]
MMIQAAAEYIKSTKDALEDRQSLLKAINISLAGMELGGKPYDSDSYVRIRIRKVLVQSQCDQFEHLLNAIKDMDDETLAGYIERNPNLTEWSRDNLTNKQVNMIDTELKGIKSVIGERRMMKLMLQLMNTEQNTGGAKA